MAEYWNKEFDIMSWDQLHIYWLESFKNLVEHVKASSPFYSKHLEDISSKNIKSFQSITKVPFMTKHEIRDAQMKGTREFPLGTIQTAKTRDIVQVISSSGTTGRPVYYGITERDLESWRDSLANFTFTAGIRREDVVLHIVAYRFLQEASLISKA